ncbi:MAG TPA: LD-carboxypeptidase [bacterium]|nr:LD-carboxypeptidase [bacterium]
MAVTLRKPRPLAAGDTIGLVSPSGPTRPGGAGSTPESVERTRARLHEVGFRTVVAPHAFDARGYLAGTDADRAADLQAMLANPAVHGVLCIRGGYGAHRLLDRLDYRAIDRRPKVFIGYSDITALHFAFYTQCGFVTFHGPMAGALAQPEPHDYLELLRAVTRTAPLGRLVNPPGAPAIETLVPGVAEGRLIGGNAALLTGLLGTRFVPAAEEFRGKILFLEDLGDKLYRLDRKLAHLKLAGVLEAVSGIVVGECRYSPEAGDALSLRDILRDHIVPLGKPAIYGLACGHGDYHLTLPMGVRARLDAAECSLSIEEAGVEA